MLLIELKTRHTGEYWHRGHFQPGPDNAIFPHTKRSLHGGWSYRPGTSPAPARLMPALIWYPPSPCRVAVEHASRNPPPSPRARDCLPTSIPSSVCIITTCPMLHNFPDAGDKSCHQDRAPRTSWIHPETIPTGIRASMREDHDWD